MESYPKASVPVGGNLQPQTGSDGFSEVLLHQYTEIDVSSEWLSSFVEECLSSAGNCHMPPKEHQTATTTITNSTLKQVKPNQKLGIPGKPRGQRKRKVTYSTTHKNPLTEWSDQLKQISPSLQSAFCDPPYLLEQTYWLADSELITMPRKEEEEEEEEKAVEKVEKENNQGQQRRCSHCQAQKTPQWRAGPSGPKTLCNACGMRYFKSGRLLPEYRPAKSPTFVNFKHSNSHKKVLQMRMTLKD